MKKQTENAKDQYKLFKDQINLINTKREDDVKIEDGEIIDNVHHNYTDDKYEDLINNIFRYGLKDKHFCLTNFDNSIGLENIVNRYCNEKDINLFENCYFK